ncbi:PRD domain-containing protein [Crassaminicella thermophila]|uniref:PRD domain-containing protein n=1 Tax=Crassaminicella thermophila TaxID=2599308 RepID=A0A5C0SDU1_CRATE|nr:PRD domain-containing protein [Crassaminicella thermophila]QEK11498.1 PRD domain-containing protein [Crassaminicella thermophila]
MEKYTIKKILSNNVVLVENENQSYVLVGKGIGFGKKKGFVIENPKSIEEKFISLKGLSENEYENFLTKVDPKIIELVEEIMEMVKSELGKGLNPNVHVGLIDHINFAIKRLKEGIEIVNPFLIETKILYPVEYSLAEKAVQILKENLKIDIPEAEIGFLALHIYGGRGDKTKNEALENSKMMNTIVSYVEKRFNIQMDRNSFNYRRFIMHLRGVIDRVTNHKTIENILLEKVKDELRYEFRAAYDISKIMEKTLKVRVPESEVGYIALHLHRIRSQNRS